MNRRTAREIALQALYELEFCEANAADACQAVLSLLNMDETENCDFASGLVQGVRNNLEPIDAVISGLSEGWDVNRMPLVDRNIIRIAVYEMRFADERTPDGAAINEAVELAKSFGSDETRKFVNGLLASVAKSPADVVNV